MTQEEQLVRGILSAIGDDPNREGLIETPSRVVKSWKEIFGGYGKDPKAVLGKTFESGGYHQMVVVKNIEIRSTCEHHMLPFYGKCHIAYIPGERVVGLSKLPRLVEIFARRLQIQEAMTQQIADAIQDALNPTGVGVVIEAQHMCMVARGVRHQEASMVTSALLGSFFNDSRTREEFLALVRKA